MYLHGEHKTSREREGFIYLYTLLLFPRSRGSSSTSHVGNREKLFSPDAFFTTGGINYMKKERRWDLHAESINNIKCEGTPLVVDSLLSPLLATSRCNVIND